MYTAFICIWGLPKPVFVNLTQDTVAWEEGIQIDITSLTDLPMKKSLEHLIDADAGVNS